MSYSLSPYDNNMASHVANNSHTSRRTSRSSHSYRIEKPRSSHNSPMVVERRKTTTGAKLYTSLDDHYRMMMGVTDDDMVQEPFNASTRPVSWHPSSTHFNVQPHMEQTQPQDWSRHYSGSSGNSAPHSDFYSLSARNSYFEPATYTIPTSDGPHHRRSQGSDSSYQTKPYGQSSDVIPANDSMPWYLQEWARKNPDQLMDTRYSSTDFLPIQHPATESTDEVMGNSEKELVGMGLYDETDPTTEWGSLVEATGKGLKLEETWQPPEQEDDDEEEEEDDASSDDGEEELPPPAQQQQQPIPVAAGMKPQTRNSLAGQSFFFDEDDSVTKEWWYQLREHSIPVRDAGLSYGHGWL